MPSKRKSNDAPRPRCNPPPKRHQHSETPDLCTSFEPDSGYSQTLFADSSAEVLLPVNKRNEAAAKIMRRGLCRIYLLAEFVKLYSSIYLGIKEDPLPSPPKKILRLFSHDFGYMPGKPFDSARVLNEKSLEDLIGKRLKSAYSFKISAQMKLEEGFRAGIVSHQGGHICALFCIKRPFVEIDKLDHIDQVSAYLIEIIRRYPDVCSVSVLITNGWSFRVGHLHRKSLADFSLSFVEETFVLYDEETGALNERGLSLFHIFARPKIQSLLNLKFETKIGSGFVKVTVRGLVGIGGSGCVYDCDLKPAAKWKNTPMVVKFVKDEDLANQESYSLNQVQSLNITPRFHSQLPAGMLLSKCTPVITSLGSGTNANSLEGRHFLDILDCLIRLHQFGMVHRDVRMQNIVLDGNHALLADFGAATTIGSFSAHCGTRETASQRVLKLKIKLSVDEIDALASDDMESLFKTFLMWRFPCLVNGVRNCISYKQYHNFWAPRMVMFLRSNTVEDWAVYLRWLFSIRITDK